MVEACYPGSYVGPVMWTGSSFRLLEEKQVWTGCVVCTVPLVSHGLGTLPEPGSQMPGGPAGEEPFYGEDTPAGRLIPFCTVPGPVLCGEWETSVLSSWTL